MSHKHEVFDKRLKEILEFLSNEFGAAKINTASGIQIVLHDKTEVVIYPTYRDIINDDRNRLAYLVESEKRRLERKTQNETLRNHPN